MYEMLVGLEVSDNEIYAQYRAAMKPILATFEGAFGYDFMVSEVLLSQVSEPINRVFTINFPTQLSANNFFEDNDYQSIKSQYFEASVRNTVIIASYEKQA
ncbi:hypothetical protein PSECIP111951_02257 [Pseudoalteromonas holothuriae]|uniref:DUF1330 domain-containing protein n=1 Tax=Pseudoalteromonas holothuriae TaxID=2963714 RepID=A0A9W4QZT0_9GAMM|nr:MULTISPECIES: DUF1330 domain-containing protein [unclassified Pseudoalteromonas]CAH9060326.1 hypothetical protein PSECIP111951_02257 [Pseudoalteromonas sp. CIP111951]CAH9060499.1 hypothetical protein PSECIP111854_02617 [Pseudoalteromonas sp. CIP111854]